MTPPPLMGGTGLTLGGVLQGGWGVVLGNGVQRSVSHALCMQGLRMLRVLRCLTPVVVLATMDTRAPRSEQNKAERGVLARVG